MPSPSPSTARLLFALAAGLAVLGQVLVLRDGLVGKTPAASQTSAGRMREALWIVIPAIALALTLLATWRSLPAAGGSMIPAKRAPVKMPATAAPVAD